MKRTDGWERRFSAFLTARKAMPFQWGKNDCLMMQADGVLSCTGFDPGAQWRGIYSDEAGAYALLDQYGGHEGIITAGMGFPPHEQYLRATRGDVCLLNLPGNQPLSGIVDDSGQWITTAMSDIGRVIRFPLSRAVKIWSY